MNIWNLMQVADSYSLCVYAYTDEEIRMLFSYQKILSLLLIGRQVDEGKPQSAHENSSQPAKQGERRKRREDREVCQPLFPPLPPPFSSPSLSSGPPVCKTSLITPRPQDGADGETTHRRHHGAPEENEQPAFERCNAKKSSGRGL